MKYCLFYFFLIFSTHYTYSQQIQVFGKVTDLKDIPLPGATINYEIKQGTIADKNGNFYFETDANESLQMTVRFIGYETIDTIIRIENESKIFLDFKLKLQLTELPNIEITAEYQNIFEDYKHHITDFTISDEIIYLIIKKGQKAFLSRTNLKGTVLEENELKGGYSKFHNSCLGGIILVGDESCAELHVINDKVLITNEFSIDYFNKYIIPCKLQKDETLIFKGISRHNKKIDYFRYFNDHNPHIIYSVHDEIGESVSQSYFADMIGIYMHEAETTSIKDIDYGFNRENIIDDGTWNGDIQDLIITNLTHQYVLQYQALALKEVKSDLFVVDGTIFILDELNNQIVQINNELESTTILDKFDHQGKIQIISDNKKESYFLIDDILYSIEIEKNKFNISPVTEIEHSFFTQRNQLYDGVLYRLGRKSINNVQKTIFRDKIESKSF